MQNFTYNNQTKKVKHPFVRITGIWLVLIGTVVVLATLVGGRYELNPFIFMVGYGISLYITEFNSFVKNKYILNGKLNTLQKKMAKYGDISLFPLMFVLGGSFIPSGDWRMVWLGTLLATGIHFLMFIPVHGPVMTYLSLICTILAITGIIFKEIPFMTIGFIDGILKIIVGLYLFLKYDIYLEKITSIVERRHEDENLSS